MDKSKITEATAPPKKTSVGHQQPRHSSTNCFDVVLMDGKTERIICSFVHFDAGVVQFIDSGRRPHITVAAYGSGAWVSVRYRDEGDVPDDRPEIAG